MNEENEKNTENLDQTTEEIVENFQEKYLYLLADFQNYKRRMEKQQEMLIKYSLENFFQEFIEVIDNFDRIIASLEVFEDKQYKNMMLGFSMINKQFSDIFTSFINNESKISLAASVLLFLLSTVYMIVFNPCFSQQCISLYNKAVFPTLAFPVKKFIPS